jgi:outer membrane receptor protein involved in Fe transport
VNLRVFADLGQQRSLVQRYGWLRGARVTLAFNNLFDARQDVRDDAGAVPIGFQPDLLDPVGRSVRISVRKAFFGPPPGERRRNRARGAD